MPGLFRQQKNTVNMIRHDHKCIQRHIFEMIRKLAPAFFYRVTNRIQPHVSFGNLAKNTHRFLRRWLRNILRDTSNQIQTAAASAADRANPNHKVYIATHSSHKLTSDSRSIMPPDGTRRALLESERLQAPWLDKRCPAGPKSE